MAEFYEKRGSEYAYSKDNQETNKKRKCDSASPAAKASASKPATPQFQRYHLSVLLSLYETDDEKAAETLSTDNNDDDNSSDNSIAGEGHKDSQVDGNLWAQTKILLREREDLIQQMNESSHLNNIHKESLNSMEEQTSSPTKDVENQLSPSPPHWSTKMDSSEFQGSTYNHNLFSPRQSVAIFASNCNCNDKHHPRPARIGRYSMNRFRLVATILEQQFRSYERAVRRRSSPYEPVYHQTKARIVQLKNKIQKIQEGALTEQKQTVQDLLSRPVPSSPTGPPIRGVHIGSAAPCTSNSNDRMSKLHTKFQLWRMLATDLQEIVQTDGRTYDE